MEADPLLENLDGLLPLEVDAPGLGSVPANLPAAVEDLCAALQREPGVDDVSVGRQVYRAAAQSPLPCFDVGDDPALTVCGNSWRRTRCRWILSTDTRHLPMPQRAAGQPTVMCLQQLQCLPPACAAATPPARALGRYLIFAWKASMAQGVRSGLDGVTLC